MEKKYLKTVKDYIENNGHLDNDFGSFSKIYSMTTENIYGFLSNYDLKDKKVLTVAGSGDQRLNAYLMGAKEVTCFDVNPLTLLHLDLKDAAICNINFEKFIKFFGIYSRRYGDYYKTLDIRIFEELKNMIREDTYEFFNYIITDSKLNSTNIYYEFENEINKLQRMNNYLTPNNYESLRNIIKDKPIKFINSDIKLLPDMLNNEKYDLILLSNISDYTHNLFFSNDLKRYRELINKLSNNLNTYGIIQVGYIYDDYTEKNNTSDFNISEERYKFFPPNEFYTLKVNSYNLNNKYDKVIVYKKNK